MPEEEKTKKKKSEITLTSSLEPTPPQSTSVIVEPEQTEEPKETGPQSTPQQDSETSAGGMDIYNQMVKLFKQAMAPMSKIYGIILKKTNDKIYGIILKKTNDIIKKIKGEDKGKEIEIKANNQTLEPEVKEQPEPSADLNSDPKADSLSTINSKPNSTLTSAISVLKSVLKPMFKLFSGKPKPATKEKKDNTAKAKAKALTVKVLNATRKMPYIEAAFFDLKENASATDEPAKRSGPVKEAITTAYKFTKLSSRSLVMQLPPDLKDKKKGPKEETQRTLRRK